MFAVCIDCIVEFGEWSRCENDQRSRKEYIVHETVGSGLACPSDDELVTKTEGRLSQRLIKNILEANNKICH